MSVVNKEATYLLTYKCLRVLGPGPDRRGNGPAGPFEIESADGRPGLRFQLFGGLGPHWTGDFGTETCTTYPHSNTDAVKPHPDTCRIN